jgi:predicted protein tyrosine phosphatase
MEKKHVRRLKEKFFEELIGKPLICLNIPDDYKFMQSELIDVLNAAVVSQLESLLIR